MPAPMMDTYSPPDLVFDHGKGTRLYTEAGDAYLDFISGIAVNCLGPCPSQGCGRPQRAGRQALAPVQHVQGAQGDRTGREALRGDLRRPRLLHQFRRRGDGMRAQDGAPLSLCERQSAALSHHHLHRRLPRPHLWRDQCRRQSEIPRGLRPGDGRVRPGRIRRSGRREECRHRRDRGDLRRAGAGRGRCARAGGQLPARPASALRRAWSDADL